MKIGIFGDSFADFNNAFSNNENESWIASLQKTIDAKFGTYARSGTSLWYSFDLFLKNYQSYSHIVFCFTYPHRIHYLPEKFNGFEHVKDPGFIKFLPKDQLEFKEIFSVYWKHLFNEKFDLFVCNQIFNVVQDICTQNNIKLVNLLPFDTETGIYDISKREGDCYLGLQAISSLEIETSTSKRLPPIGDRRWCHLTKENNDILAELIKKSIDNNTKEIYNLETDKRFVFSKEISDRYFY
jgi:hypothetical protein